MLRSCRITAAAMALVGGESAAWAIQEAAGSMHLEVDPILDARLRFEDVDQPMLEADGLTLRLRAGAEARSGRWSALAEAEGTLALIDRYNAFPFPLSGEEQSRPGYAVIADPQNLELNRLQLQYKSERATVTLGRQRINLDDQRWVGSVGWRQNEQTFDALRGEGWIGPVGVDLTYSVSQRTVFGTDAGPRAAYNGDFLLAGLSSRLGLLQGKLFAYLIDYDEAIFLANSSQTYGGFLAGSVPLVEDMRLSLRASYARQSDYGRNPFDYAADYWSFEGATSAAGFTVTVGWEQLGSDNGRSVQTPMATLHKFNGWADMFLTTPPTGLEDAYVGIGRRFDGIRLLPGLSANLTFHRFDSAAAATEYGTEWDASIGFQLSGIGILLKYADYDADGFGTDTRKFWLQAEWSF